MATRNLARSAVEGGRRGRDMDRWKTRAERQATRIHLKRIHSVEDADEAAPAPLRFSEWREFTDHLQPTERFLQSRAGRPWNKVFSELCAKYDRRTLKGWHLLTTHVTRGYMVRGIGPRTPWYEWSSGARVDEHGILRYVPRKRWGLR